MSQVGFIPGMQGWLKSETHINRMKSNHQVTFSTDARKAFDKIQHPLWKQNKTLNKPGLEGALLTW
jgi:hypothetical protein